MAAALVALSVSLGASAPGREEVRGSGLLRIDAVVVDRSGAPVTDLARPDFEVWIGGYRVPIETIELVTSEAATAREIVLLLDDITVEPPLVPRAREVTRRFVTRMSPDHRMAIVSLSGQALARTDDRTRLLRAADSYFTRGIGVVLLEELRAQFLQTISQIAIGLAELPDRRKTIVGIGSAWLLDTPVPPPGAVRDLRAEWTDAMRALALAGASFYVIDPGGVGAVPAGYAGSGFARETGGHAFINTNDLTGAADRILRETRSYYIIGVADPRIHLTSDLRELDVRVGRRGVTVRARRAIPGRP